VNSIDWNLEQRKVHIKLANQIKWLNFMISQLIQIEVDLRDSLYSMEQAIQDELKKHGHPLQWIVLDVDIVRQKVYVDAIVSSSN
jgi:hypothetical protein